MIVGLISDTHGLMRESALAALRDTDLIVHAGDVGTSAVLDALRSVAPVVAVRGNVDRGMWASELPATAITEAGRARIYVLHDLHELNFDPARAGIDMVVSGHSHKASQTELDGVLYLNPGSAGPRRFRLPLTVARLEVDAQLRKVTFIELSA